LPRDRGAPELKTLNDPRPRRSTEEIVGRILEAAADEFKLNGFGGATTAAIAKRAQVTETQLFRHFGTKAKLFEAAIFTPFDEQLRAFLDQHVPMADNAELRAGSGLYVDALSHLLRENIGTIRTLLVASAFEKHQRDGAEALAGLQKYFERGASGLSERYDVRMNPDLLVRVSFAAVLGCVMFRDWLFPEGMATDEEIDKAAKQFVVDGVSANLR